jgi:hypothetical protein
VILGLAYRRWSAGSGGAGIGAVDPSAAESDVTAELKRLRRENEILRQERDILKKATAFFARREVDEVHAHRRQGLWLTDVTVAIDLKAAPVFLRSGAFGVACGCGETASRSSWGRCCGVTGATL